MKILSLFDGISCARVALERADFKIDKYYASEVDKYAIQIAQKNYFDTIQLGNIKDINCTGDVLHFGKGRLAETSIDLIIGGSPCQDLSIAKKDRKGLQGERSGLFWEYVRILKEVKPKYFILENVASMPKEAKQIITETLGVEPIMINASLVSAQSRKRLFWVGAYIESMGYLRVNVQQPEDKGILLRDILEDGDCDRLKSYCIDANYFKGGKIGGTHQYSTRNYTIRIGQIGKGGQGDRIYSPNGKSVTLSANGGGRGAKTGLYCVSSKQKHTTISKDKSSSLVSAMGMGGGHIPMITEDFIEIRKLTPLECERLQCLPDGWTEGISNSQRYKCLGNAFCVDVVSHILKFIR